jgi:hypothetical protein
VLAVVLLDAFERRKVKAHASIGLVGVGRCSTAWMILSSIESPLAKVCADAAFDP